MQPGMAGHGTLASVLSGVSNKCGPKAKGPSECGLTTPENPAGFVVRTEAQKAAWDNGFRLERGKRWARS
jgi:hypothetical protein